MRQVEIVEGDHVRGSPDGGGPPPDIVIIEYGDFQCPYCARAQASSSMASATRGIRTGNR